MNPRSAASPSPGYRGLRNSDSAYAPPRVNHSVRMALTKTSLALVDRKAPDQRLDPLAHRRLDQRVLLAALLRQRIEHFGDQLADLTELGDAEAARRAGRRAEADAGRDG